MRKRLLIAVPLVLCVLLLACVFAMAKWKHLSSDSVPEYQKSTQLGDYSNGELQELLRVMAVLSTDRQKPLAARMLDLSPYHRVLILAAVQTGFEITSRIDEEKVHEPMALEFDKNEMERLTKEFDEDIYILWSYYDKKILGIGEDKLEVLDLSARSEVITSAILSILDNHKNHSAAFIQDALDFTYICWTRGSDSFKEDNYWKLRRHMELIPDESVRRSIFGLFHSFKKHKESTYKFYVKDRNKFIAHRSAKLLIEKGNAEYLPDYVRFTWLLYGNWSGYTDASVMPIVTISPERLFEDLIETDKRLNSEKSQLRWLEKNIDKLKWDEKKEIYIVAEKQ